MIRNIKVKIRVPGQVLAVILAGQSAWPQAPKSAAPPGLTGRIKDIAAVEGVRDNQLFGYGLVVGLAGTGDKRQTVFSAQSLSNMLERMGVSVSATALQARNTAAVMVTATLPPFAQPGIQLDVTVAAIGDATTLQGGLLLLTPLKAANGQVYAAAQGPVVTGGFVAGQSGANAQTVNHPTAGRVPGGAIVEQSPPSIFGDGQFRLQLRRSDVTNAMRVAEAVNGRFSSLPSPIARAEHPGAVLVALPPGFRERPVEFLSIVENLPLLLDRRAKIVINERTGTIVMGKELRIAPVSILHGNLTVEVETSFDVSQPAPFGEGRTVVTPQVGVGVNQQKANNVSIKPGASVEDLVQALLAIQSTPRDIIAILQNLQAAGALSAEIEVI
jgi:flagellar P-ring protein precursor FlgI